MIDDENVQTTDPVLELPPTAEPEPDQQPAAPPILVVPLEDVLEYLSQQNADPEETADPEESLETVDGEVDLPAVDPATAILEHLLDMILDLGKIERHLDEIEKDTDEIQLDVMTIAQTLDHPALTTSFADYTVTEALLLFLLLAAFVSACARMLKGGLSWLRS